MTFALTTDAPPMESVLARYDSVGWSAYTSDPETLGRALHGSSHVVCAWDGDRLVGPARVISDGATIAYLQDVLVHPGLHQRGIGRRLVQAAFEPFAAVHQKVLLTDDDDSQRAFYTALGFTETHDVGPSPVRAYVRFDG
ncbi:GNAT family N-acetyltransferase [Micrococcus terreus]|nr:GNAT family N-acetyltransferase [Micrococcus terreus]